MRWWVFGIWAYVLLGLQRGLAGTGGVATFETDWGPIEPMFLLPLAVFVGLSASPGVVFAAWGVLGLCMDVATPWTLADGGGLTLIGPYTLGFLAGAYTILEMRSMLLRYHPLTIASMVVVSGIAVMLIVTLLFSLRAWYEPVSGWSATDELIRRSVGLLYTAAVGLPLASIFVRMAGAFGFTHTQGKGRRFGR